MKQLLVALSLMVCGCLQTATAAVSVHRLFSNNMVLQRNAVVPVWGYATANETVIVSFNGQTHTTQSGNGKWMVYLKPMQAQSSPLTMTIKGASNEIVVTNILVGEVWLCAGQSNMEWGLFKTNGGEEAIAQSANSLLRIFNVPHNGQMQPVDDINSKWELSSPASTKRISAVGYYFLSRLQQQLKVPVGFINASYGGTTIEAWMSREMLAQQMVQDKYMNADIMKAEYDSLLAKARPLIAAYEAAKDSAKKFNLPVPERPAGIPLEYKGTTSIYNGEIYPLMPFAIKGVAWYQGESNAYPQRAGTYQQLLVGMVQGWRKQWQRPDLPFIIIQISGDTKKLQSDPVEKSGKAMLKAAQLQAVKALEHAVLVTTSDCGEMDVHYREKKPVGERVCNAALTLAYQQPIEYTGPLYDGHTIRGSEIIVRFAHAGNGLVIRTDSLKPASLYGFAIAGADRKFYHARARIENNQVVVSAAEVPHPLAVRYAWADFSFQWNLFNKEGYPASSFRTDDWPL